MADWRSLKVLWPGDEAVSEPGDEGPDDAVPSAIWQQADQFIDGVIGVFNDHVGLLPTPLGVEVLHGWQLHPGDVLYSLAVQLPYQVVMQPVRILSMLHLLQRILESMLSLRSLRRKKSRCLAVSVRGCILLLSCHPNVRKPGFQIRTIPLTILILSTRVKNNFEAFIYLSPVCGPTFPAVCCATMLPCYNIQ